MDGFFNVYKPAGWTSFDVVAALRRPLKQKRLGHAGTLDPAATGVLPLAAGYATRLIDYLVESDKEYIADIELGRTTDTYDSAGEETSSADWTGVTIDDLLRELDAFRGPIRQRPPAYSAIKIAGEAAYKRMRRGESVDLAEREVVVHELELLAFDPPTVRLRVVCSKGTYLRSIAHDLGQALGPGAFLAGLTRSRVGPFRVTDAVPVEELREAATAGGVASFVISADIAVRSLDAAILGDRSESDLRHGRPVRLYPGVPRGAGRQLPLGRRCRGYTVDGAFFSILEYAGPPSLWRPLKVFARPEIGFK